MGFSGLSFLPFLLLALIRAQQAPWDASLVLHSNETRDKFNSRCLDGTNPGFYFRPASSPSAATKWRLHFQGGGWCFNAEDCLTRSSGWGGTSKVWPPLLSEMWGAGGAGFSGILSLNTTDINPFGDFALAWFSYCDGSSQTSNRDQPLLVNNTPLFFRGRAILDAHLYELERKYQFLSEATEVIVSGTSAGGMSALLHTSFLRTQLRQPGARVVAVPDAGWWWDTPSLVDPTQRPFWASLTGAIGPGLWNATLRGPSGVACLGSPPQGDPALCYLQPWAYAFNDVPTFVVQSLVDPYNLQYCGDGPCRLQGNTPGTCTPAQVGDTTAFSHRLGDSIVGAQARHGDRDAHFLTTCSVHEGTCRGFDWWGISIAGATMNASFTGWYTGGMGGVQASARDVDWPGDASCLYPSPGKDVNHGYC